MSSTFTTRAGYVGAVGALIGLAIALVNQFSVPVVPLDQTSYPLEPNMFAIVESILVVFHITTFVLVLAFARSGLAGSSRIAKVSLAIALVGLGAHVFAEAGYAVAANTAIDDPLPTALSAVFGIATILVAIGMVVAGIATLRAHVWVGWGRFTPLAFGVMTVILIALIFSNDTRNWALATWCLVIGIMGVALATRRPAGPR